MASFATPQALYIGSGKEMKSLSCYVMLAAIGVHSCSILLYRGFSEFYRSSIVSLDCWTLVTVSISVQIRQVPLTFHPEHQEYVSWSHGTAALF